MIAVSGGRNAQKKGKIVSRREGGLGVSGNNVFREKLSEDPESTTLRGMDSGEVLRRGGDLAEEEGASSYKLQNSLRMGRGT